jgi:hypothetical protein
VSVLEPPVVHDVLKEEIDNSSEILRPGAAKMVSVASSSTAGASSPDFTGKSYSLNLVI